MARGDNVGFDIGRIVLLAFHEWLDVWRRNEPGVIPELRHLARLVAASGLEHDQARRMSSHETPELLARQLLAARHMTVVLAPWSWNPRFAKSTPIIESFNLPFSTSRGFEHHELGTLRCRLGRPATIPTTRN